jgi:hypothetical protein
MEAPLSAAGKVRSDEAHDFPANNRRRQGKFVELALASRIAVPFRRSRLDRGHSSAGKLAVCPTGRSELSSVALRREVISRFSRKD